MNFQGEYEIIPQLTREGIMRYVEHGRQPGGFLTSVLCNDLFGAVGKADRENLAALPVIVRWFANNCPALYGAANMREHIASKRKDS
jgi:hypothetical protein